VAAAAAWWGTDTAPYPYAQRWLLDLPLPFLTNRRLDALLGARPGERVLEIGPGTGLQALHVAGQLGPSGRLDIVDIQQPMLDHVVRRAAARNVGAIVPTRADARDLPFDDESFDAAYLVTVLGEIPNPRAAVREIRRVLKPDGRLVVGEFLDRHFVALVTLLGYANESGLRPSAWLGPPLAYFARFQASLTSMLRGRPGLSRPAPRRLGSGPAPRRPAIALEAGQPGPESGWPAGQAFRLRNRIIPAAIAIAA
jgi:ubiquinone/menaquinone biosynthesis C-methylase UbiE